MLKIKFSKKKYKNCGKKEFFPLKFDILQYFVGKLYEHRTTIR